MIHLVLLSGGSGKRLWPLSNDARSKQFLKVLRDSDGNPQSMVQNVMNHLSKVGAEFDITIATGEAQANSIRAQVNGDYGLVLEPERRDTAPAIMLACAYLGFQRNTPEDDTIIVMPIDTYAEQEFYDQIVSLDEAVQDGDSDMVLLGVQPTYPSEKYGYIIPSFQTLPRKSVAIPVARFREKPNEREALEMIENGALWNCGVFAFKLSFITKLLESYCAVQSFDEVLRGYNRLPKNSFDYEVVEKAGSVSVIPHTGYWRDLGTWNTLTEEMACFGAGRVSGLDTCDNTHVINELNTPLITLGINNAVVVVTPDGILVSDKQASSFMKPYVDDSAEPRPMYEQRPWGEYRVLDSEESAPGMKTLVKELLVRSGKQFSYQRHRSRSEVWNVVDGCGEAVLDGEVIPLKRGSTVSIENGAMHSCRALTDLRLIEVQMGDRVVEEDIERFGFYWPNDLEGDQ